MKVIVTRPSPDAEAFAAAITKLGAEPILSPVMVIRARDAVIDVEGVTALAFTSANGVRVFAALSGERNLPIFSVGPATAGAAQDAGFARIAAAKGDVESLGALIAEAKPSGLVLHLAGSDRAGDLVALLAKKGVAARRAVLYDAVKMPEMAAPARAALARAAENVAVAFFSARSARLFLEQAEIAGVGGKLASAAALCLSAEVAAAAKEARWRTIEIAAEPTSDGVIALVRRMLAGRNGRNGSASRTPDRRV